MAPRQQRVENRPPLPGVTTQQLFEDYKKLSKTCPTDAFAFKRLTIAEAKWRGLYNGRVLLARKEQMEVNQPEPSSPFRTPAICLYVYTRAKQRLAFTFATMYAAHHALDLISDGTVMTWVNDTTVQFGNLVEISTLLPKDIEEVLEYELNDAEELWVTPEPRASIFRSIASGLYRERDPAAPTRGQLRREARKSSSTPAPSRAGLTTIADLANEYKLTATKARALLRAAKISKPSIGWAFTEEQLPAIRKALTS